MLQLSNFLVAVHLNKQEVKCFTDAKLFKRNRSEAASLYSLVIHLKNAWGPELPLAHENTLVCFLKVLIRSRSYLAMSCTLATTLHAAPQVVRITLTEFSTPVTGT